MRSLPRTKASPWLAPSPATVGAPLPSRDRSAADHRRRGVSACARRGRPQAQAEAGQEADQQRARRPRGVQLPAARRRPSRCATRRTQLNAARVQLATTRGELAAAQVLDARCRPSSTRRSPPGHRPRGARRRARRTSATQKVAVGQMAAELPDRRPVAAVLRMVLDRAGPRGADPAPTSVHERHRQGERHPRRPHRRQGAAHRPGGQRRRRRRTTSRPRRKDGRREPRQLMRGARAAGRGPEESVRALVVKRATRLRRRREDQAARRPRAGPAAAPARTAIAAALRKRALALAARNAQEARPAPTSAGGYLDDPVNGPVTSPFGYRIHPIYGYYSLHDGIDFGAGCGQPLYAAADGTGHAALLSRPSGATGWSSTTATPTASAWARSTTTPPATSSAPGQRVQRGQVIGYVGTTGWSTGCHLHFTVMVNGRPMNPMNWF